MKVTTAFAVLLAGVALSSPLSKRGVQFGWGNEKVRGVNIGGWLVLEPWITPSIFQTLNQANGSQIVDEYTLGQYAAAKAPKILKKHWDTWVSEADFQKIANHGFNTVRIPIGYWAYTNAPPYISGAAPYLDTAINWARATGLKVLIDLHGAPGSQNGFDNSGHNGTVGWGTGNTVLDTVAIIQQIFNKYGRHEYQDVVVGIELLNEPLKWKIDGGFDTIQSYYDQAFTKIRKVSDTPVIMHDGFINASVWDGTLTAPDDQGVILDHHEYQVFTQKLIDLSPKEHLKMICTNAPSFAANSDHWVIVGEWSAAMTDCATSLNGYRTGSRWEGTLPGSLPSTRTCGRINSLESWNATQKQNTQKYINAQLDVYEQQTQGSIFWNFKTEGSPEWDLFRLLDAGIFPNLKGREANSMCSL